MPLREVTAEEAYGTGQQTPTAPRAGGLREVSPEDAYGTQRPILDNPYVKPVIKFGLPVAGGLVGGALGAVGGPVTMVGGDIAGSEVGQQGVEYLYPEERPKTPEEALKAMGERVALGAVMGPVLTGAGKLAKGAFTGGGKVAPEALQGAERGAKEVGQWLTPAEKGGRLAQAVEGLAEATPTGGQIVARKEKVGEAAREGLEAIRDTAGERADIAQQINESVDSFIASGKLERSPMYEQVKAAARAVDPKEFDSIRAVIADARARFPMASEQGNPVSKALSSVEHTLDALPSLSPADQWEALKDLRTPLSEALRGAGAGGKAINPTAEKVRATLEAISGKEAATLREADKKTKAFYDWAGEWQAARQAGEATEQSLFNLLKNPDKLQALAEVNPQLPKDVATAFLATGIDKALTKQTGGFYKALASGIDKLPPSVKKQYFGPEVRQRAEDLAHLLDVTQKIPQGNKSGTAKVGLVGSGIWSALSGDPTALTTLGGFMLTGEISGRLLNTESASQLYTAVQRAALSPESKQRLARVITQLSTQSTSDGGEQSANQIGGTMQ